MLFHVPHRKRTRRRLRLVASRTASRDHRYVVCRNQDEARKDAADRQAIVASLREQLRSGAKSLVGNRGYRQYLSTSGPDSFQVDEAKIVEDARYDGKWILIEIHALYYT